MRNRVELNDPKINKGLYMCMKALGIAREVAYERWCEYKMKY